MSTVAKKVIMGSGGVPEEWALEQSLIFDDGSSTNLTRTPSSASNRKTWTWSGWVKRSQLSSSSVFAFFGACDSNAANSNWLGFVNDSLAFIVGDGSTGNVITTAVFRDPSAWYHIVFVYDSTQGTAANRQKIYVNGVQETSFSASTYINQNVDGYINSNVQHSVGSRIRPSGTSSLFFDGYLAETNFIDGTALTPSSFGETTSATGQWTPKEYEGSYGTNGFYLKFASGDIGTDSSGQGNNYTASNLANSDVVIDTPTNNFATLNPAVSATSGMVLSEGNLHGVFRSASITNAQQAVSTIDMPAGSGKWYWEMRQTYTGLGFIMGIVPKGELPRMSYAGSLGYGYVNSGGVKTINATESSYGTAWFTSGQTYIISCYYDSDNRKVGFKLNNTDQGYVSEDVTAGSYAAAFSNASGGSGSQPTTINFGQNGTFNGAVTAQGNADTNGIGDFYYAPPSGYKALCTANLPDPAIPLPSAHFNTVLYTGNGGTNAITGVGFQPDLVWIKSRSLAKYHVFTDVLRGVNKELYLPSTAAEYTQTDGLTAFGSDGFTLGADAEYNTNGATQVSWSWKGNGSGSTDTSGDIDAVVSANQAAGFSIITWTGDGGAHTTVPHGLGVAPEIIFEKYRNATGAYYTWVTAIDGTNDFLTLNTTNAAGDAGASGTPTSQFFSNWGSPSGRTNVAYAFVSKPSFSKIGVYTGNGSADGPFVNTGFKPAWLLYKITSTTITNGGDWRIYDSKRSVSNPVKLGLYPNLANAEDSGFDFDLLSNGFKVRASNNDLNQNGQTFLYMAFAESPFKTSNAH
jgi:hypothetical protein